MKRFLTFAFSCLTLSLLVVACGNSDNSNNTAVPACPAGMIWNGSMCQYANGYTNGYGNGYGTCPTAGYIQTQQGCLPPCATQPGYGQLPTGACLPPYTNGAYPTYPGTTYPGTYPTYPTYPSYGWPNYGGSGYNCRQRCSSWGCYWYCL